MSAKKSSTIKFRKTITLDNGVKVNLSSGTGVTYSFPTGQKGKHITIGNNGVYGYMNLGNGFYTREKLKMNETNNDNIIKIDSKNKEKEDENPMNKFHIYTDGGCCNTQSKTVGSWAFIILKGDSKTEKLDDFKVVKKLSGKVLETTNNKMEMEAVFQGVKFLKECGCNVEEDEVKIISDSAYVIKGSTEWVQKWESNNWKTLSGNDVKNQDLWKKMIVIKNSIKNLSYEWVKGHDNDKYNIECDAMCQSEIRKGVEELQKGIKDVL